LGIGDWGLGIGDWGLGIGPNPQSPITFLFIKMRIKLILLFMNELFTLNNKVFEKWNHKLKD
jgi:hypothetical protein